MHPVERSQQRRAYARQAQEKAAARAVEAERSGERARLAQAAALDAVERLAALLAQPRPDLRAGSRPVFPPAADDR